jgi:hypothetical protein
LIGGRGKAQSTLHGPQSGIWKTGFQNKTSFDGGHCLYLSTL